MTDREVQKYIKSAKAEINRLEKLKPPCGPTERIYWILGYQRGKLAILENLDLDFYETLEEVIKDDF